MFYNSIDESYNGVDESTIMANEDYRSVDSFAQTLVDIEQNNYALFEGLIMADFQELAAVKSGRISESEIVAFREGTMSDVWNKIKEMFKKLWEKVKAILNHFLAFISGVFVRDNKKLVALWGDKIAGKDLSKLKVTWRNIDHDPASVASTLKTNVESAFTLSSIQRMKRGKGKDEFDTALKAAINTNIQDALDAKEDYFLGKATNVLYTSVDSTVRSVLLSGKEPLKTVKDTHKDLEKLMKDCIKEVDEFAEEFKEGKTQADLNRKFGYDDNDNSRYHAEHDDAGVSRAVASAKEASQAASEIQKSVTKVTNLCVSTMKKHMAQCRAAFLKAAHYNPKNESAFDDIDARVLYEDTMYEIDSDYDSFCYE